MAAFIGGLWIGGVHMSYQTPKLPSRSLEVLTSLVARSRADAVDRAQPQVLRNFPRCPALRN